MRPMKVLFISGSLGLGHAARDLAIAAELRRLDSSVDIVWLAAEPATTMLRSAGETVLPEAREWAQETAVAESVASGYSSSVFRYVVKAYDGMDRNAAVFERVTSREQFDLVVGDETYELWEPLAKKPARLGCPFVMIYDFIGFDPRGGGLVERLGSYYFNRMWVGSDRRILADGRNLALFVGEPEDIPDAGLGPLLPNRRTHAADHYQFTGYVLPFDPHEHDDRVSLRHRLGYGDGPTIVVAIGGTAIGQPLLDLCAQSFPLIKRRVPGARMRIVCGPRVAPESVQLPADTDGLAVEGFVPRLHEHLAACDLAIVQGGGTTTLELTALGQPFLYFPLQGHFEQEVAVSARLARHRAGIKMRFSETTPGSLAETVVANLGRGAVSRTIPTDGASVAARAAMNTVFA